MGSATVFINGKSAHRMGDLTRHCGGMGRLVEGSANVIVGEDGAGSDGGSRRSGTAGRSSDGDTANGRGSSGGAGEGAAQSEPSKTDSSISPVTSARTPGTGPSTGDPAGAREADRTHYVELEFEDADGKPLSGATYEIKEPGGAIHKGTLDITGKARADRLPEGTCEMTFTSIGKNPRSNA